MVNQISISVLVNLPLHNPYVLDISSLTNISTTFTFYVTHPPIYESLHRHLLTKKEGTKQLVLYIKYLMPLITIVNFNRHLGIPKLIQISFSVQRRCHFSAQ